MIRSRRISDFGWGSMRHNRKREKGERKEWGGGKTASAGVNLVAPVGAHRKLHISDSMMISDRWQ